MSDATTPAGGRPRASTSLGGVLSGLATLFVAAGGIAVTILAPAPVADRILREDVQAEALIWRHRLLSSLENGAETFARGQVTEADLRYLETISRASEVYRLKLFTAGGEVFWSTRQSDIGTVTDKPYFFDTVVAGETYYKQAVKPSSEIDNLAYHTLDPNEARDHHVAEIYTPIVQNGQVVGAVEFYRDFSIVRAALIERLRLGFGIVSALLTLIVGGAAATVSRANRRQLAAMEGRAERERLSLERQMRLAREVQLLGELNEWLQSAASLQELFDMVARYLTHILPEAEGSLYVYSNSRDVLDGAVAWNGGALRKHIRADDCWGLRRGRTYSYGTSEVQFACDHTDPEDGRPYFCFPILAHGETVGLMHLRAARGVSTDAFRAQQKMAQMCAEQISMAIANVQMRDELHDQSVRDPLTGLFNRRHMTECLRRMTDRLNKTGKGYALISVDVDHFKKFNDTHGHDAGDMVLRAVGDALDRAVDGDEVACRMGGEEFMLLLPDADAETGRLRAEELRAAMSKVHVRYGDKTLPRITISLGVAEAPTHGTLPQDLMKAADDALYAAKDAGRDCVRVAQRRSGTGDGDDRVAAQSETATDSDGAAGTPGTENETDEKGLGIAAE